MNVPYRRVQVIINPAAGGREPILNTIHEVFAGTPVAWEARVTQGPGDATRLAREAVVAGCDLVAGYGGDGTLLEVVNGLHGSDVPLAILPGGTGNAMAFELGIPRDLRQAAELIVTSANRRAIDLAGSGERVFMLRAYTGLDPALKSGHELKARYGNLAYLGETIRFALEAADVHYRATVDGEVYEGDFLLCLIVNAGSTGTALLPHLADVQVDDGLLDFYAITRELNPLLALAHYVFDIGDFQAGVYHRQGREVSLEAGTAQPVWLDGEADGTTPLTARVLPRALEVVVA